MENQQMHGNFDPFHSKRCLLNLATVSSVDHVPGPGIQQSPCCWSTTGCGATGVQWSCDPLARPVADAENKFLSALAFPIERWNGSSTCYQAKSWRIATGFMMIIIGTLQVQGILRRPTRMNPLCARPALRAFPVGTCLKESKTEINRLCSGLLIHTVKHKQP